LLYFLNRLKAQGVNDPGRCLVAVTEVDSYLSVLAKNYGFRATFLDSPGIKGPYSSLIHFGLLLSAVWNSERQTFVSQAAAMRDASGSPLLSTKTQPWASLHSSRPARLMGITSFFCWVQGACGI
jgi:hypothetical protein